MEGKEEGGLHGTIAILAKKKVCCECTPPIRFPYFLKSAASPEAEAGGGSGLEEVQIHKIRVPHDDV